MKLHRIALFVCVVSLALLGSGCANGGSKFAMWPGLSAEITGIGDESAVLGKHGVGRFDSVKVAGAPLKGLPLTLLDVVKSKDIVLVHVTADNPDPTKPKYNYQVLMGPKFKTATGDPDTEAKGWVLDDLPSFRINTAGWVFGWGYLPFIRDRWVSAAAAGTTIAIEPYDVLGKKTRVYLIGDAVTAAPKVTITCLATGATTTISDVDHFIDVTNCAAGFPAPQTIGSTGTPSGDFVAKAKDVATAAGWR